MKTRVFNCSMFVFLIFFLSLSSTTPVHALEIGDTWEIDVETTLDGADFVENSVCEYLPTPVQGFCTLRAAIEEAHRAVEDYNVIINLPSGTYTLSIPKGTTIEDSESGDLDLDGLAGPSSYSILIRGTGQQPSVIDANGIDRVLHIGAYHEVTLQNLTITGGLLTGTETHLYGGGIKTELGSEVTISHVNLIDNQIECPSSTPSCSMGGGIYTENSHLLLSHSRVSNNRAYSGSAIGAWDGSGSPPQFMTNTLNSLFDQHSLTGGSVIEANTNLRVINTTMTNNTGSEYSSNIKALGPLWVENSTLVYPYYGTNVVVQNSEGYNTSIRNSVLVSYTFEESGWGRRNCGVFGDGVLTSEGGNVFTDTSCNPNTTLYDRVIKDGQVVSSPADALLGPLQDNGGKLMTMKPLSGSPAIDRRPGICVINVPGETAYSLTYDARDFPRDDGVCDAGAVEQQKPFKGYLPAILR